MGQFPVAGTICAGPGSMTHSRPGSRAWPRNWASGVSGGADHVRVAVERVVRHLLEEPGPAQQFVRMAHKYSSSKNSRAVNSIARRRRNPRSSTRQTMADLLGDPGLPPRLQDPDDHE